MVKKSQETSKPKIPDEKSVVFNFEIRLRRTRFTAPKLPITTKKPYDSSAKKRVVSRQKFSVLQKNAKKCKKKHAFARLYKAAQNHAKISVFRPFQRNTRDFSVNPMQNETKQKEDPSSSK